MTLVLGLDIGSTTTKAALVRVAEPVIVLRVARTPTPSDTSELIAAAAAVARECLAGAPEPVAAVGIASMAESGAVLDASGNGLTPLLRWDRQLDRAHLHRLLSRHPALPESTGVPATTKPAAVALTALRADDPELFGAMSHWAGVADLVAHALTGTRALDHTLAARTMIAGDRGDRWDAAVLDTLGVSAGALPELRAPGEAVDRTGERARTFGLGPGVPVHIAGHDHAVGAWAAGVRAAGAVADSLGTAEAIVRVTHVADADRAIADGFSVGRTVDGTALTVLGGSPACGAMFAWWRAEHPREDAVGLLGGESASPWATSDALVLPYPSGRQCPRPDPVGRVRVLRRGADGRDRARGLLQSLVFHARWMRETIDTHAGSPATHIAVLGSLADRIPAWAGLAAAAGVPTSACAAGEPVAAGAALLAAVRAGEASPTATLSRRPVTAASAPGLDAAYRRFLDAVLEEGES